MYITKDMLNFHGSANGGVLFSIADVAFACAINSYNHTAVGITVTIHYMKTVAVDEHIIAVAKEDTKYSCLGLYRIEIYNKRKELVALAEGMVYRKKDTLILESIII